MRKKLIVGNWKMNGSLDLARSLVREIQRGVSISDSADIILCPPTIYLRYVAELIAGSRFIFLGAQDSSEHSAGAYTGEVSPEMLKEVGCEYVIAGHSERRQYHGETDGLVARKTIAVLEKAMKPIACVGETLAERQNGMTREVIERQVDSILGMIPNDALERSSFAYEPVWAIGTGQTATPNQAQEVHSWIRQRLENRDERAARNCKILYGGSVNGDNAASVLEQPDVDGCLIGGASLNAVEFVRIYNAAIF